MTTPVFGITGWKNSGKTTLVTRLVAEFARRGYRVSTVKHAHHDFDIDKPATDSFRHREAGASEVMIVSGHRWALMHELRGEDEPPLEAALGRPSPPTTPRMRTADHLSTSTTLPAWPIS